MPLVKPATIELDAAHGFMNGLVAAYLLTEGTNVTLRDSSGRGNHIFKIDGADPGWTNPDGNNPYMVKTAIGRWGVNSNVSDFKHLSSDPWTVIVHFARRGQSAGSFPRIAFRTTTNTADLAISGTGWNPSFFTGAAWVQVTADTNFSGVDTMYAFVYDGSTVKVIKGTSAGVTQVYSNAHSITSTGTLSWWGNNSEDVFGSLYGMFYHRRALSFNEVATHYSDPFGAFDGPPPPNLHFSPDNTFVPNVFTGLSDGSFYATDRPSPSHVLDWLGGR